jgi:hypothetical protein
MQFVNYSDQWTLEVFWVGEDSCLVSRKVLHNGDSHVELMSPEHVWCLTVSRRRHIVSSSGKRSEIDDHDGTCHIDPSGNYEEDVPHMSSLSLLVRPPSVERRTKFSLATSVLWVPWCSLSYAECSKQFFAPAQGVTAESMDVFFRVFDAPSNSKKKSSHGRK